MEDLAGLIEGLGSDGERMVDSLVLFQGRIDRGRAFAKQDVVVADVETGHDVVAQPALWRQAQKFPVEILGHVQVIHRYRPVGYAFDFQNSHDPLL